MTVHNLTCLASFKRALTVGSQWETRFISKVHPSLTVRRVVDRARASKVRFKTLDEGISVTSSSHLFRKASQYQFNGDHVAAYDSSGLPYAIYRPLEGTQCLVEDDQLNSTPCHTDSEQSAV